MPRSKILRGIHKQLDRAQLRNRLDTKQPVKSTNDYKYLISWFEDNISTSELNNVEAINVKSFLYATSNIRLTSEERLRNLAIYLEENVYWEMRSWLAIDRIYCAAKSINANDIRVHHSRALTAHLFHTTIDDSQSKERIQKVAFDAIETALAINNKDVESLYLKGTLYYFSDEHSKHQALMYYEKALEVNTQHSWSLLYKAHCLHDLQHWKEAAEAYLKVKADFFCGNHSWRYEIFLEQKAYCYFRAGEENKALSEFVCLIERWSKNNHLHREAYGMHLAEIAKQKPDFFPKDIVHFIKQQGWMT